MLKVKLVRVGKRGQPQYRIVVAEGKSKLTGAVVDQLGHYNPLGDKPSLTLDQAKYDSWLAKGARPTDTVRALATKNTKSSQSTK